MIIHALIDYLLVVKNCLNYHIINILSIAKPRFLISRFYEIFYIHLIPPEADKESNAYGGGFKKFR